MSNQKIKRFKQDKFYYSFSPLHKPTLRVKSGETLVIEVPDAFVWGISSGYKVSPAFGMTLSPSSNILSK
ncbi:hypothetical protein ES705_48245 [subsurface metagenome]